MTWCPLRHSFETLPHLRGKFKREHVVDIHLVSGHDDLAEQTAGDSLAFLKRKPFPASFPHLRLQRFP
jgi:hypothetical protein